MTSVFQPENLPCMLGAGTGISSSVPVSNEAVGDNTRDTPRAQRDDDEDWSRWRGVVFRAKRRLMPPDTEFTPRKQQHRRKRAGSVAFVEANYSFTKEPKSCPTTEETLRLDVSNPTVPEFDMDAPPLLPGPPLDDMPTTPTSLVLEPTPSSSPPQLSDMEVLEKISRMEPSPVHPEHVYCPECYLSLHPDPRPEKLYMFLHALKYTTSLGAFETDLPEWAAEGFQWDQS